MSHLYTGSISDKQLTLESGLLNLLEKGDSVMADRGFDHIAPDLQTCGIALNIPPFLRDKQQLFIKEVVEIRRIAL